MTCVLSALLSATAPQAAAQSTAPADTLAEARRLRDAGEYAAAATLLVPYAAGHEDDAGSARFAALMAYWSKDFATARSVYGQAMERHPADADLRLEYAQFLMGVGETSQARAVISPLVETGSRAIPATGQALTILGTLEYWRGDFPRARSLFIEKLRLDSTDAEARRQLRDIEIASAAWIAVGAVGGHDDQPINHGGATLDAGVFLTPLVPLTARVTSTRHEFAGANESVTRAEAAIGAFFPAARMDISAGAGVVTRTIDDGGDWTARGSLGFRLPGSVVLEGRAERAPYLNTRSSLVTPVTTTTLEGSLRWRPSSGWMADATGRREAFEDDNSMATGYVWILAPLARRTAGQIHVGYSFSAQAADKNRFVVAGEPLNVPPGQLPETVPGEYRPYYTPRNLRVHSLLMAAVARPSERWSLSANGTLGVHARDEAPVLFRDSPSPNANVRRTFYRREFTPWNLRGAIEGSATESVRLALTAEHGKTAFYSFTTVNARLTYTFVAAARRRADRY